ncbi:MAG: uracil phosphoribosyltransferase [Bacteroidetes bacterium]|nr:uracil phosphoribosyltransferase [Bacteroidota bacterium]PHX82998.1 MAG: uracil phosphoribosyltransferase [Flavobacteriales bacterium]
MIIDLSTQNSVLNMYMSELRDLQVQKDSMRFRLNIERIGALMGYEISKKFEYISTEVTTPLGIAIVPVLKEQPVIATILRAGLPLHHGMLSTFDKADNAFVSAYRKHHKDNTFDVHVDYLASPSIEGKELILCDPMLATGTSMVLAYQALLRHGRPKHIHVVSILSSMFGIDYVKKNLPENTSIWTCAIDDELTVQSFIVPGLGDAGDLAYGAKL